MEEDMTGNFPIEGDPIGTENEPKSILKKNEAVLIGVATPQKLRVLGNLPPEHIGKDIDSIGVTSLEKRQYRVAFGM
jgi:hypothetical protein